MKDKIAEKVLELYDKGVKQNVIAQQLNLSTAKVWRIINKNTPKDKDHYTEEDYEVYEETVNGNAPDENPAEDSASENLEIPGNSSEEDLNVPNDNSADDFASENSEIPGNSSGENSAPDDLPEDSSEDGFPEQMRTIAEMTSAETARKITESYKEVMDLMGSVTREIMENSVSGMDKATRMLLTASERLNAISERQEKQLAACSQNGNRAELHPEESGKNTFLYLLPTLLLIFAVFSFGGICGMADLLYLAVGTCGVLLAAAMLLVFFYCRSGGKTSLMVSILALAAAVPALISGYFFFLIEKSVMHIWGYALAGVPVGVIIGHLCIMRKK